MLAGLPFSTQCKARQGVTLTRAVIAGILATATLWAAAQAAPPSGQPQPIYTRQVAFTIPFRVGTSEDPARQPVEIQLHTSSDLGQNWTLIRTVPPNASSFAVRAPADGEYWFCVRTKDASGAVRPDGPYAPDLRVIVDTQVPEPKLNAWHGAAGELSAQWEIKDANLDVASMELDYRAGEGAWQPIAFERLSPGTKRETYVGMTTWLPAERAAQYEVRLRIRDMAGNPTDHRTTVTANWNGGATGGATAASPPPANPGYGANQGFTPNQGYPPQQGYDAHSPAYGNPPNSNAPIGIGSQSSDDAASSRTLPRPPQSTGPVPQSIPRGGIPANVVPVQSGAGGEASASASSPYPRAVTSISGAAKPGVPANDLYQTGRGGANDTPNNVQNDSTWNSAAPGGDPATTNYQPPYNNDGSGLSNDRYGNDGYRQDGGAVSPLPSVPWNRPGASDGGLTNAGDRYRQPFGANPQEPYGASPADSVAWPADNQSSQPLDRARLSPYGSPGGSAVQFQSQGSTSGAGRGNVPDDDRVGVTYPTKLDNTGGIHFQESNTGNPYRPPMESVTRPKADERNNESGRPAGDGDSLPPIGARRPWMIRSRSFELKYDLPQAALRSRRVEVWGTSNSGQTWQRYGVDADGQSPASVGVPGEGLYGFKLVVQNDQGLVEFPPARGDEPDVWIQVDLTRPNCRLIRAEQGRAPRDNELTIEWEAADDHLGQLPVTLEYSRTLQGPWQPISPELPNTGRYVWTMPERTPAAFHLRLRVRDEAGNEGEFITAEKVSPARPAAGRIFDVHPTQENWEQSSRGRMYHFR